MAIIPINKKMSSCFPVSVILRKIIEDEENKKKNGDKVENIQPTETKKIAKIILITTLSQPKLVSGLA